MLNMKNCWFLDVVALFEGYLFRVTCWSFPGKRPTRNMRKSNEMRNEPFCFWRELPSKSHQKGNRKTSTQTIPWIGDMLVFRMVATLFKTHDLFYPKGHVFSIQKGQVVNFQVHFCIKFDPPLKRTCPIFHDPWKIRGEQPLNRVFFVHCSCALRFFFGCRTCRWISQTSSTSNFRRSWR